MTKKLFLITAALILGGRSLNYAQTYQWAKSMGGKDSMPDYLASIAADAFGNIYSTGFFQDTADFDPGSGTAIFSPGGNSDAVFISKLDANGNFLWAKSMGGGGAFARGNSITIDGFGETSSVYTIGDFEGTVDFDPGSGTTNLTSIGNQDIFISKLDANGNFLWVKTMAGISTSWGTSITTDASGNVYSTGYFRSMCDFDPGSGIANLTTPTPFDEDIFICKLDANGNFVWAKNMGSSSSDVGSSITTDASGNVYTTGVFQGTVDFDPSSGTANLTAASADAFICKLDANGNFLWAKNMGANDVDYGYSIITDASGNVYTTGNFQDTVDFDPGNGTTNLTSVGGFDIFISKLDANGNFLWAKSIGSSSVINAGDKVTSIIPDISGNVYITGYYNGTADFDPGSGTANLTSLGNQDVFICKLDALGNYVWAKNMGALGNNTAGTDLTIDALQNVYVGGVYEGTVDFDPGFPTANLTSVGYGDVFICKLGQLSTEVEVQENSFTNSLKIFPNPNNGAFIVKATNEGVYSIINGLGQTIQQVNLNSENNYSVSIQNLSTGIYFIAGFNNNQMSTQKIVVTK